MPVPRHPHRLAPRLHLHRYLPVSVREFGRVAWQANITGLSAMLAYNMLYGIVPLSLLGLFVAGRVLASNAAQHAIELTLQDFFPGTTKHTLDSLLAQVAHSTSTTGVLALIASLWLASSFWGALDTSFSRIYGCSSRPWLAQKRFGLLMVVVVVALLLATVMVPTLQSLLRASASHLPFLLRHVHGAVYAASLAFSVLVLFSCLATIYARVPNRPVPWHAVWPGAIAATGLIFLLAIVFPVYLAHISTIARFASTSTVVFIVIALGWFYLCALIILAGAVMNCVALRRRDAPTGPLGLASAAETTTAVPAVASQGVPALEPGVDSDRSGLPSERAQTGGGRSVQDGAASAPSGPIGTGRGSCQRGRLEWLRRREAP